MAAAVVLLVAAGVLLWVAASRDDGGIGQLSSRDPHGAAACRDLRDWAAGRVKGSRIEVGVAAGGEAAQATTGGIRATVAPLLDNQTGGVVGAGGDLRAANLTQLRDACIAAGVNVGTLPAP